MEISKVGSMADLIKFYGEKDKNKNGKLGTDEIEDVKGYDQNKDNELSPWEVMEAVNQSQPILTYTQAQKGMKNHPIFSSKEIDSIKELNESGISFTVIQTGPKIGGKNPLADKKGPAEPEKSPKKTFTDIKEGIKGLMEELLERIGEDYEKLPVKSATKLELEAGQGEVGIDKKLQALMKKVETLKKEIEAILKELEGLEEKSEDIETTSEENEKTSGKGFVVPWTAGSEKTPKEKPSEVKEPPKEKKEPPKAGGSNPWE